MNDLLFLIFLVSMGGLLSVSGGVLFLRSDKSAKKLALYATPFAAGALLSAVFMDLLIDGVEQSSPRVVFSFAMAGVLLFFIGEKALGHTHSEHNHEKTHTVQDRQNKTEIWLVVIGNIAHNALDGMAIASSFLISPSTGIVTTVAVAAHEIPHQIGNFGLLLSKKLSRLIVLLINVASILPTIFAASAVYLLGKSNTAVPVGALLGLSAGFLLYIAMSDIMPKVGKKNTHSSVYVPILMVVLGAVLVSFIISYTHSLE